MDAWPYTENRPHPTREEQLRYRVVHRNRETGRITLIVASYGSRDMAERHARIHQQTGRVPGSNRVEVEDRWA